MVPGGRLMTYVLLPDLAERWYRTLIYGTDELPREYCGFIPFYNNVREEEDDVPLSERGFGV
jgi:hypothetical protein